MRLRSICMAAALAALAAGAAVAAPTIDGDRTGGDGYETALNSAAGVDTNVNFGFGTSAKSESIVSTDDASFLYVHVEGSIHSGNKLFVLVDSDANSATGVSAAPPDGSFGESNALEFLNAFSVGFDTVIAVGCEGDNPTTNLYLTLLAYSNTGSPTIVDESFAGSTGPTLVGSIADTIRTVNANLGVAFINGDAANHGVELAIPRAWTANPSATTGQYRIQVVNGSGGNNFWSDSAIPQLAASGNIGFTGGPAQARLGGLTAPVWDYGTTSVGDWNMY